MLHFAIRDAFFLRYGLSAASALTDGQIQEAIEASKKTDTLDEIAQYIASKIDGLEPRS